LAGINPVNRPVTRSQRHLVNGDEYQDQSSNQGVNHPPDRVTDQPVNNITPPQRTRLDSGNSDEIFGTPSADLQTPRSNIIDQTVVKAENFPKEVINTYLKFLDRALREGELSLLMTLLCHQ
jgi:hypothetical protein